MSTVSYSFRCLHFDLDSLLGSRIKLWFQFSLGQQIRRLEENVDSIHFHWYQWFDLYSVCGMITKRSISTTTRIKTPRKKLTAVTLANVNPSVLTHSFDPGENDDFIYRLDYGNRKRRILSPAVWIIDGNDVIRQNLLNEGEKVNFHTHGDSSLGHHGKHWLQFLLPMSILDHAENYDFSSRLDPEIWGKCRLYSLSLMLTIWS